MKQRSTRTPKLSFTENRNIGWHVNFRDPQTGTPKRHRFGMIDEAKAKVLYHTWLGQHLAGETPRRAAGRPRTAPARGMQTSSKIEVSIAPGSLAEVASAVLKNLETRTRKGDGPRARGTISPAVYSDRRKHIRDFLDYMNEVHGSGAIGRLRIPDLQMSDVEGFNQHIVEKGYSGSQVAKRLQMIRSLINRSGRPEHGQQVLSWNWELRETFHGAPPADRRLPTVSQLKKILTHCTIREKTMVWMAIGMGFGQRDLATIRVEQIDKKSYDLRRAKTGVERYGDTPRLVWTCLQQYLHEIPRPTGEQLFLTRNGLPLVHERSDSVTQWWSTVREKIGETQYTLQGFYVLRHLGATEFGSRKGCSISEMKRWLGHSASSSVADVYMKPVLPEKKAVVEWVRKRLKAAKLDLVSRTHSKSSKSG